MEKAPDNLNIGQITEYFDKRGYGFIINLNYNYRYIRYRDKKRKYFFHISNCKGSVNKGRIIVFKIRKRINKKGVEAYNIEDFDPSIHSSLIEYFTFMDTYIRLPENLYLKEYIIKHKLDDIYVSLIERLSKIENLLNHFDEVNINKIVQNYKVYVKELHRWKPGDDDSASIEIFNERPFDNDDPYLSKLFPECSKILASGNHYAPWWEILDGLWKNIGGENKKKELEDECLHLQETIKKNALDKYCKEDHIKVLNILYFIRKKEIDDYLKGEKINSDEFNWLKF